MTDKELQQWLNKGKKKRKKDAERWNKANPDKKVYPGGVPIPKRKPKPSSRNTGGTKYKSHNPHKLSKSAEKARNKALTTYSFPRAVLGVWDGITSALTGFKMSKGMDIDHKKLYKSKSYKGGNIAGNMLTYGGGYASAAKATGKAAAKAITSKTGKRIVSRAAKTRLAKSAARKSLAKAGQRATKKAVEHTARKVAKNTAKSAAKNFIADATVGTVMNSNIARSEGKKVGSKEWQKEMALNAALDLGVGGVSELAPLLKGSNKKVVEVLVDGKVKKIKVDPPIKRAPKAELPAKPKKVTVKAPLPKKASDARIDAPFDISPEKSYDSAKAKAFDEQFEKEVKDLADHIKNYKKQGVSYVWHPDKDRMDLGWESNAGFGYSTRVSDNEKWHQEVYKKLGRTPNKSEAEDIAREYLMDDLFYTLNNPKHVSSTELGASDELKNLYLDLNGKSKPKQSITLSQEAAQKIKNNEFQDYLESYYGRGQELVDYVQQSGKTFSEFINETYNDFVMTRDLGADVYKPSTQERNAAVYGIDVGVVNATPYGETSKAAKTMYNSDMLDDVAKQRLQEDINEGLHTKYTLTNKRALSDVDDKIAKHGIEQTRSDFESVVRDGRQATSKDILTGYRLSEYYQSIGDYDSAMEIMVDITTMESEIGRTLQAMRIFNNLTPAGRVKSVARQVEKLSNETGIQIEVPPELLKTLGEATDEVSINRTKKEIMTEVWNQIPAEWAVKANAWRRTCMLGNPKTHIRNMLGNALFVPVKATRNVVATGLERMLIRGKNTVRSKAILTPMDGDLVKAGADDFELVKDALTGNSRYFEGMRDLDAKVFKNRALEGLRKFNAGLLEKEDELFMKYAYKRAYGQFLKANNVKRIADASDDILRMAREYASKESLNSTYRDASVLADWLASGKKYADMPMSMIPGDSNKMKALKKVGSTALDTIIPFSKTPINILRRGWDYSPGGLIQGTVKLLRAGGDNQKLMDGIAKFASGLTGTGIVGVGYMMGFNDMARGSLDTSTKKGEYMEQSGEQEYSIRIGDYTYTMDWAAPVSMPFFVGVQLGNEFAERGFGFGETISALKRITDPVFNLSMLSGISNALSTVVGSNTLLEVAGNTVKSYATQFIPTAAGQLARTITPERRSTISTAENADVAKTERFINRIENKIPFLANNNEPYVDVWGQTEAKKTGKDYAISAFENFLSPGILKKTTKDNVDEELFRLAEKTGDYSDIAPKKSDKDDFTQKINNKSYRMNEKDFTEFSKARGQYAKRELSKLFNTKRYRNATDSEKKKMINDIYRDAKEQARKDFLLSKGVSKETYALSNMGKIAKKAYKESGMGIERFEKLYKTRDKITDADKRLSTSMKLANGGAKTYKEAQAVAPHDISERSFENGRNLVNLGIRPNEVNKIANGADTDGSGRLKSSELVNYLEGTNYTRREKAYIFQALANWNARNPYY